MWSCALEATAARPPDPFDKDFAAAEFWVYIVGVIPKLFYSGRAPSPVDSGAVAITAVDRSPWECCRHFMAPVRFRPLSPSTRRVFGHKLIKRVCCQDSVGEVARCHLWRAVHLYCRALPWLIGSVGMPKRGFVPSDNGRRVRGDGMPTEQNLTVC